MSATAEAIGFIEAELQVPPGDWLQVYGLLAQSLTLDQILPSLGFQQKTGDVDALKHPVSSQYADGLFVQQQDSTGKIYNLCGATPATLHALDEDLQKALALFKARQKWLTSDSRLSFGVIYERKVVVLADTCATEHAQLKPFLDVLVSVTNEQLSRVDEFNLICCSNCVETWKDGLTQSNEENIASAVQWIEQIKPQTTPFKTNIVEGIVKALAHSEAEGVYLLAHGDCTLRAVDLLLEKVSPSLIPVHLVLYDCKSPQALEQYKQLTSASGARCHTYTSPSVATHLHENKKNPLLSSFSSLSSAGGKSPPQRPSSGRSSSSISKSRPQSALASSTLPTGPDFTQTPTEDILSIVEEIELTRDTLAKVQALHLEVGVVDRSPPPAEEPEVSEDSLTSQQWLEVYGIKVKKLRYEDLVSSLAFQHCNGTVQIPVPKYKKDTQTIEMIPHTRIVHAQYCKDFVHIRWNGEKTVHVQLTGRTHRTYRGKVESTVSKCEKRILWLKKGSRQLFGTLLESKVVILIDTSSSVKERLNLIKKKVEELLQEQLSQKKEFTLVHFNSEVHPWRTSLVPTSTQNLLAVGQWVQNLLAEGSTNTLGALEMALSVRDAEAVYMLTDGRPDQPLDEILARVQQLPSIPVHTISFNCADSKANYFLAQLASNTAGRYYYFSEDTTDPEGPNTYQSEDIQRLEEEIEYSKEQLNLADHLLSKCNVVRRKGKRGKKRKGTVAKVTAGRRAKKLNTSGNKPLMSSKRWLEKNSLSSLHLTLMDAFGPASIPHSSKHIPLLGKDVSSKVFSNLFPLAHVTNGNKVTLINPNGVNLKDYERRLNQQIQVYRKRLSRLAHSAIPDENLSSLGGECEVSEDEEDEESEEKEEPTIPSYKKHRDKLRRAMADCGWPRPKEDFDLLEKEIDLANNFKKYLKALKNDIARSGSRSASLNNDAQLNTSGYRWSEGGEVRSQSRNASLNDAQSNASDYRLSDENESEVVGLFSPPISDFSVMSVKMDELSTSFPKTREKKRECRRYRKGQHVAVRPENDGFYYPGVVSGYADHKRVLVKLVDGQISAPLENVIIVGGSVPCPVLCTSDYVLVRVRTRNGPHSSTVEGLCDYYVPGMIHAQPDDLRKASARYSVLMFNGKGVTCPRHGIIKIGKSKYRESCSFIRENGVRPPTPETLFRDSDSHSGSKLSSSRSPIHIPCASESPCSSPSPPSQTPPPQIRSRSSSPQYSKSPSESLSQNLEGSKASLITKKDDLSFDDMKSILGQQMMQGQQRMEGELLEQQQKMQGLMEQQQKMWGELLEQQKELVDQQQRMRGELLDQQQKMRGELLEQQQRELSSILHHQQELGEENRSREEGNSSHTEKEEPNFIDGSNSHVDAMCASEPDKNYSLTTGTVTGSPNDLPTASATHEQAVNTDPWTEEKAVVTDPMTESRGVGTEWSDSSMESESESESEAESDSRLSTPHAAAPEHFSDTLSPKHDILTPVPSLTQITGLTPVPSLTPSPLHSHTFLTPSGTPAHTTNPDRSTTHMEDSFAQHNFSVEEEDPLVNQHVLARWPDDGWYYRGLVRQSLGEMWYQVQDASLDVETIYASDIIIDLQDAQKPLTIGDTVAALHPSYGYSYAPGKVTGMASDGFHFAVKLYDGTKTFLPRQEIYSLARAKQQQDIEYLWRKEKEWVGLAVMVRRDRDGLYLPAKVVKQLAGPCQYLIRWTNGSTQAQTVTHMFGKLTKKRGLRQGDHVLALAIPNQGVFMPGTIQEKVGQNLQVEFCDGQSSLVDPFKCFWISLEYYQEAVKFIADSVSSSSATSVSSLKTEDLESAFSSITKSDKMSEYTAS